MPFVRRFRKRGIRLILWIDDLLVIVLNPHPKAHGGAGSDLDSFLDGVECGGLTSCPLCQKSYMAALDLQSEIKRNFHDLGWFTNEKDVGPS